MILGIRIMLVVTLASLWGCNKDRKLKIIELQIVNPVRNDTLTIYNCYTSDDSLLYQVALNDTFYPTPPSSFSDSIFSYDLLHKYIENFQDTFDSRPLYPKIIRQSQRHEFVMKQPKTTQPMQYYMTDSSNTLSKVYWYYQPTKNGNLLIICSINGHNVHTYDLIQTKVHDYDKKGTITSFTRWQSEDSLIYYPEFDIFQSQSEYWGTALGGNNGYLYRIENGLLKQISNELPIDGGCGFPFDSINYACIKFRSRLIQNNENIFSIEITYNLELMDTYTDSNPVKILSNCKKLIPLQNVNGLLNAEENENLLMPDGFTPLFHRELLQVKKYGNKEQRHLLRLYK